ncbi:hypothetical protein GGR54DRAFT_592879, partial [Hypoxylon sp. NC1633]
MDSAFPSASIHLRVLSFFSFPLCWIDGWMADIVGSRWLWPGPSQRVGSGATRLTSFLEHPQEPPLFDSLSRRSRCVSLEQAGLGAPRPRLCGLRGG